MEKVINLTPDFLETLDTIEKKEIHHRISGGPKKTKIILRNPDTGEILQEVENKVVILSIGIGENSLLCKIISTYLKSSFPYIYDAYYLLVISDLYIFQFVY